MLIHTGGQNHRINLTTPSNRVSCNIQKNIILLNLDIVEFIRMFLSNKGKAIMAKAIIIDILTSNKRVRTVVKIDFTTTPGRCTTTYFCTDSPKTNRSPLTPHTPSPSCIFYLYYFERLIGPKKGPEAGNDPYIGVFEPSIDVRRRDIDVCRRDIDACRRDIDVRRRGIDVRRWDTDVYMPHTEPPE